MPYERLQRMAALSKHGNTATIRAELFQQYKLYVMSEILFNCSSLGDIMTASRSKSDPLSETCKNYLEELHIKIKHKRKRFVDNKYFAKGRIAEEAAIGMLSRHFSQELFKNDEFLQNDFIQGIPDVITDEITIENKSPFDIFTFYKAKRKLEKKYYWQVMGELALTGHQTGYLAYCLVDTPQFIINQEKRRLQYTMDIVNDEGDYLDKCEEIDRLSKYSDIPESEKIHIFEVERDEEAIKSIYEKVAQCREFIKTL